MRKTIASSIILAAMCLSGHIHAQSIGFWIESGKVSLPDGTVLGPENFNQGGFNVTVYGSTVSNPGSLQLAVQEFLSSIANGSPVDAFQSFIGESIFAGPVAGDRWSSVPLQGALFDWAGTLTNLPIGNHPVLLITTNPVDSLTIDDFIGLAYASAITVPALGTTNVGFSSGTGVSARWDTVLIGDSSSLVLMQIPEPATVALFSGLLMLGVVLWRRRR